MLEGEDIFPDNWIYIHEADVNVGRIQNYRSWSPWMVPDPDTACVGLEYFVFEGDEMWTSSDDDLVALATHELEQLGLAKADQVLRGYVVRVPKAYPMYDAEYADRVSTIRTWLDGIPGLQQVGRNGLHRYNNSDHSMLSAMRAVDNVLDDAGHDIWAVNVESAYHEEQTDADTPQPYRNGNAPVTDAMRAEEDRLHRHSREREARQSLLTEYLAALSLRREAEAESRAPGGRAWTRPQLQAPALALGQLAPDREAEPEAALAAAAAAALEALEDALLVLRRHADADVGDLERREGPVVRGLDRDLRAGRREAQRVVEQDAERPRDGSRVAAGPARAGRRHHLDGDLARARSMRELRGDRPRDLRELGRLGAQRRLGVEAREVQQVGREVREAIDLALGQLDLGQHVLAVDVAVREVLAEQLQRAAQRRQRRAQLVRRRRDERPPRALLPIQRRLHRRQRAGEVADLVAPLVARRPRAGALPGDAQRRGPQALQARGERRPRGRGRAAARRRGR